MVKNAMIYSLEGNINDIFVAKKDDCGKKVDDISDISDISDKNDRLSYH